MGKVRASKKDLAEQEARRKVAIRKLKTYFDLDLTIPTAELLVVAELKIRQAEYDGDRRRTRQEVKKGIKAYEEMQKRK